MNDAVRGLLHRFFEPPPMPPEAFPRGSGMIPGARSTLELAWQGMFYQTLTTGIAIGALGVLAIVVGVVVRQNFARTVADHLTRGIVNAAK